MVQVVAEDVVVATKNGSSIGIAFVEFKHYQDAERMQVRLPLLLVLVAAACLKLICITIVSTVQLRARHACSQSFCCTSPVNVAENCSGHECEKSLCLGMRPAACCRLSCTAGCVYTSEAVLIWAAGDTGRCVQVLDRKYFGQRYVEVSLSTLEDQQRLTGAV